MSTSTSTTARFHEAVNTFDRRVDGVFDRMRGNRVTDRLFYGASALGDHSLIWLIFAVLRGLRSRHHIKGTLSAAAVIGAESAIVNGGIKSLFRRQRPTYEGIRPLRLRKPRTSSFPSGHATSAFCAAAMLSEDDPLKPLYYGAAFVVAWSRVYVKIHHASDVVGGIVIGAVLGRVARRFVRMPVLSGPHERPGESSRRERG
jgi:undecaprenyl-diphosphatase